MSLTALCLILLAGIRARLWAELGNYREYLAAPAHFRLWRHPEIPESANYTRSLR